MKTLEIELFVKKRDCKTYDLCPGADWKGAMSDMRTGEFPQLEAITAGKPLRAKLIIEIPEREAGFYWVKIDEDSADWRVLEWTGKEWYLGAVYYAENNLFEIDERRIERVAQ